PRPPLRPAASSMSREALLEHLQQRWDIRPEISLARQRVASVTGETLRNATFELSQIFGESRLEKLNAQSWTGISRSSERAKGEADVGKYIDNLILHAESEDIAVTWGSFPSFQGGFVMRRRDGPQVIQRDPEKAPAPVDATELARVVKADVMLMLNYS